MAKSDFSAVWAWFDFVSLLAFIQHVRRKPIDFDNFVTGVATCQHFAWINVVNIHCISYSLGLSRSVIDDIAKPDNLVAKLAISRGICHLNALWRGDRCLIKQYVALQYRLLLLFLPEGVRLRHFLLFNFSGRLLLGHGWVKLIGVECTRSCSTGERLSWILCDPSLLLHLLHPLNVARACSNETSSGRVAVHITQLYDGGIHGPSRC